MVWRSLKCCLLYTSSFLSLAYLRMWGASSFKIMSVSYTHLDVYKRQVQVKPSKPIGEIGQDTFGNVPEFEDRGIRKRAILAVGRQDVDPSDLRPHTEGVEVLGASSDHLICDVEDAEDLVHVGKILSFDISYNTLLRASTSLYVSKEVV